MARQLRIGSRPVQEHVGDGARRAPKHRVATTTFPAWAAFPLATIFFVVTSCIAASAESASFSETTELDAPPVPAACVDAGGAGCSAVFVAISNGGAATTTEPGAAVSTTGTAGSDHGLAVSGTSTANSYQTGAVGGLSCAYGGTLAISAEGCAVGGGGGGVISGVNAAASGTGSAQAQEAAVSVFGSAYACGGPFPVAVSSTDANTCAGPGANASTEGGANITPP